MSIESMCFYSTYIGYLRPMKFPLTLNCFCLLKNNNGMWSVQLENCKISLVSYVFFLMSNPLLTPRTGHK